MSGGSWGYVFRDVDDIADRLEGSGEPHRRALGAHVRLLAKALHDIEWHDSGDYGPGREDAAIRAVLSEGAVLSVLVEDAHRLVYALEVELEKADPLFALETGENAKSSTGKTLGGSDG